MMCEDHHAAYLNIKSKSQDKKKKPKNPFRKTLQQKETIALRNHKCNTKFFRIPQFNIKFSSSTDLKIPQYQIQQNSSVQNSVKKTKYYEIQ